MVKDGIEAIANEILGDIQKEAEAILSNAEKEATEILRKAKEQADSSFHSATVEAKQIVQAEKRKLNSLTEVEVRNLFLQSREDLVDEAFKKAFIELKSFVTSEKYLVFLETLIIRIANNMEQKKLIVEVNAKDKAWLTTNKLKAISKRIHVELELSNKTPGYLGGCKIETKDGKITFDGTLDSRFSELKTTLRPRVAKMLFEGETKNGV